MSILFLKKKTKGLTLVEVIVAVTIFSIVMTFTIASFLTFLQYQRSLQDERQAIEILDRTLDTISREIRTGTNYECREVDDDDTDDTDGSDCTCIEFIDQIKRTVYFKFDKENESISRAVYNVPPVSVDGICENSDNFISLNFSDVKIKDGSFILDYSDNQQPYVKVKLEATYISDSGEVEEFDLATSITQRVLALTSTNSLNIRLGPTDLDRSSVSFVYRDGGCVDDFGTQYITTEESPCEISTSPKSLVFDSHQSIDNPPTNVVQGLYVIGDNGRVFYITKAKIDEVIVNGTYTDIEANLIKIDCTNDTPRECADKDVINIKKIISSYELDIILSENGNLFKITGGNIKKIVSADSGQIEFKKFIDITSQIFEGSFFFGFNVLAVDGSNNRNFYFCDASFDSCSSLADKNGFSSDLLFSRNNFLYSFSPIFWVDGGNTIYNGISFVEQDIPVSAKSVSYKALYYLGVDNNLYYREDTGTNFTDMSSIASGVSGFSDFDGPDNNKVLIKQDGGKKKIFVQTGTEEFVSLFENVKTGEIDSYSDSDMIDTIYDTEELVFPEDGGIVDFLHITGGNPYNSGQVLYAIGVNSKGEKSVFIITESDSESAQPLECSSINSNCKADLRQIVFKKKNSMGVEETTRVIKIYKLDNSIFKDSPS